MMNLGRFFLSLAIFAMASTSSASLYESEFTNLGQSYLRSLGGLNTDNADRLSGSQRDRCLSRYSPILNDGLIDIRIVIGYFDWTTGQQVSNYGYSPSIDPGAFQALRRLITGRCPGEAEFCGFDQVSGNPYRFTKRVNLQGRAYQARVDITYASVSEYLNANLGKYASEQKQRSQTSQAIFVNALQNADVVLYFGHSRNGGGPDFNPPIFIPGTNKVNYNGYYKPNRPGFKRMLSALREGHQPSIIGLMSCDSRDHFLSTLHRTAPRSGIITSLNVLDVKGVYTAMIGAADAILRGQCQRGFMSSLRMTEFNQKNITMDGMFE